MRDPTNDALDKRTYGARFAAEMEPLRARRARVYAGLKTRDDAFFKNHRKPSNGRCKYIIIHTDKNTVRGRASSAPPRRNNQKKSLLRLRLGKLFRLAPINHCLQRLPVSFHVFHARINPQRRLETLERELILVHGEITQPFLRVRAKVLRIENQYVFAILYAQIVQLHEIERRRARYCAPRQTLVSPPRSP